MSLTNILLFEFQSKNYLYHFTDVLTLFEILRTNRLEVGATNVAISNSGQTFDLDTNKKGVSLTRNREFFRKARWGEYYFAVVFDRRKLRSKYKVYPLEPNPNAKGIRNYDEEVVIDNIEPLDKFIEFVYMTPQKYERDLSSDDNRTKNTNKLIDKLNNKNISLKTFLKGSFKTIKKIEYQD